MKVRVRALALAMGIVWGLGIFGVTLWAIAAQRGLTLSHLGGYYIGYTVTFGGAFLGLIWGFANGCVVGALLAWAYNGLQGALYRSEAVSK
jgi:hypothetical protein